MAALTEPEPVALLGASEAADELLALQNDHAAAALGEMQRGSQTGWSGP